ncbi:hypothetical protein AAVH_29483, partial [Aphelenchoides avenae]
MIVLSGATFATTTNIPAKLVVGTSPADSAFCKSQSMLCAIAFFVFYIASLLPTNAAPDYPLAIGGYGKAFFNTSVPLTNAKIWVEVLASPGHGWTNATFTNMTE